MVQYIRLFGIALLLSAGVGSVTKAASFDCNKATTETEIAICGDPELGALDELMGQLWKNLDPSDSLVVEQKEWLQQRDNWSEDASGWSFVEHLLFQYLDRTKILIEQVTPEDVVSSFKSSNNWTVEHNDAQSAYVFSDQKKQFLFVPSQNKRSVEFVEYSYLSPIKLHFEINEELILIQTNHALFGTWYNEVEKYRFQKNCWRRIGVDWSGFDEVYHIVPYEILSPLQRIAWDKLLWQDPEQGFSSEVRVSVNDLTGEVVASGAYGNQFEAKIATNVLCIASS
ncbi:lysozyme inhibitor LprI family protein [Celeribacter marinus]|uniref:lysozyme inhibitor LprI family protein n=1 Tax=Celeribacter marinus TaxID=1397108 RepID=UPI00316DA57E